MAEPFKLAPRLTAATWGDLEGRLWGQHAPRGMTPTSGETIVPKLTNREMLAVIQGLRSVAAMSVSANLGPRETWATWYLYAAVAYGWDPDRDVIDTTLAQRDAFYDPDTAELMLQDMSRIMSDLDEAQRPDPELELDSGAFDDPIMQGDVIAALRQDGARAAVLTGFRGQAATKQVIPMCRDRNTGKARVPHEPCDENGKGRKWIGPDGKPIELPCDKPGDCEPIVIKSPLGGLLMIVIIGGLAYLFAPAVLGGAVAGRASRTRRDRRRKRH